jgi:hypothetical protein
MPLSFKYKIAEQKSNEICSTVKYVEFQSNTYHRIISFCHIQDGVVCQRWRLKIKDFPCILLFVLSLDFSQQHESRKIFFKLNKKGGPIQYDTSN